MEPVCQSLVGGLAGNWSSFAKASEIRPSFAEASDIRPSFAKASDIKPSFAKASEGKGANLE
jgi:hypothetical protein